jgi:hypothetical protein
MVIVFSEVQIDGARPLQFICQGAISEKFIPHFQNVQYFRRMNYVLSHLHSWKIILAFIISYELMIF